MNSTTPKTQANSAHQEARTLIRQEWIAAGKTEKQLDQEEQLLALYSRLLSSGRSEDDIDAEWECKTSEEILHEYASPASITHSA